MRFTIAKLILATLVINLVVCLTFAVPTEIGFPILTFVSLIVIPPAIVVGVVNTRGVRQAFFLGCMLSGVAHFIFCVYVAMVFAFGEAIYDSVNDGFQYMHLIGFIVGLCGGMSGVGMYYWLKFGELREDNSKRGNTNSVKDAESWKPHALDLESDQQTGSDSKRAVVPK